MVTLHTLCGAQLRANDSLRASIHQLAAASYVDPTPILEREFAECTKVYLAHDADGGLVCFYLTASHSIVTGSEELPAIHLGLSATRQDAKNRGNIALLYSRCVEEALAWQRANDQKIILWSTTASPTVFLAVSGYLENAEPRLDGSFSSHGVVLAEALRKRLGAPPTAPGQHPFVLKGVAQGTRYSSEEVHRIERVCRFKRFTLFQELGVDERTHDRLLFVAYAPDDFRGNS